MTKFLGKHIHKEIIGCGYKSHFHRISFHVLDALLIIVNYNAQRLCKW